MKIQCWAPPTTIGVLLLCHVIAEAANQETPVVAACDAYYTYLNVYVECGGRIDSTTGNYIPTSEEYYYGGYTDLVHGHYIPKGYYSDSYDASYGDDAHYYYSKQQKNASVSYSIPQQYDPDFDHHLSSEPLLATVYINITASGTDDDDAHGSADGSMDDFSSKPFYYYPVEDDYRNGSYWDSNGMYYETGWYVTIDGQRIGGDAAGQTNSTTGNYVPTREEYYYGGYTDIVHGHYIPKGYYSSGYGIDQYTHHYYKYYEPSFYPVPKPSSYPIPKPTSEYDELYHDDVSIYPYYLDKAYFIAVDKEYQDGGYWDSNGTYYELNWYVTIDGQMIVSGGKNDINGTYVPTKKEYISGGYRSCDNYADSYYYNVYESFTSCGGSTDQWGIYIPTKDEYFYGGYKSTHYGYIPKGEYNANDKFKATEAGYEKGGYYDSNGRYYTKDCGDDYYYNNYGEEVICGGSTDQWGIYIPTKDEYFYGGYKSTHYGYIPKGEYNADDKFKATEAKYEEEGYFDSDGRYYISNGTIYNDNYYIDEDYFEEDIGPNGGYYPLSVSGECGFYDPTNSEFFQQAEQCLNNVERFQVKTEMYRELLRDEVYSNSDCKYIYALLEEDDSLIADEFKILVEQLDTLDNPVDFLKWLQGVAEQSYVNVCGEIAQFNSCVIDRLLPIISDIIQDLKQDACCVNMINQISIYDYTIVERIEMLLNSVPNLFCLYREPDKFQGQINCGYAIVQSMFPPVFDEIISNFKTLVQIPQESICDAFNGYTFINTQGKTVGLDLDKPIGSCSSALDTIFSTVKMILIDQGENSLNDILKDIGFFPQDALATLENEIGSFDNLFNDESCPNVELPDGLGSLCIHLPTEFSQGCYTDWLNDGTGTLGGPMLGLFGNSKGMKVGIEEDSGENEDEEENSAGNALEPGIIPMISSAAAVLMSTLYMS